MKQKKRLGAAVVEFSFVAPLFFLIVFAFIELCRALMVTQSLEEAARSGCRIAVLKGATTSEIDAEVSRFLTPLGIAAYTLKIQPENIAAQKRWTPISVTINASFADISWLPIPKYFADKKYTSSCSLPKEYSNEN